MQPIDVLAPEDLYAGRLLAQMTVEQLAKVSGLSHDTVQRLEAGRGVLIESKSAVVCALEVQGVRFESPGYITHADGRMAVSLLALGAFHGSRIRKARWRLGWTLEKLAGLAKTTVRILRAMEQSRNLHATPSLVLYRAIGALQLAGTVFGPTRHGGRGGDYCLVPRPRRWEGGRPLRDYAIATISRPKGPRLDVAADLECILESVYPKLEKQKPPWPPELERLARARGVMLRQAREEGNE